MQAEGPKTLSPEQWIASHSNVFGRELAHLYIVLVHLFHLSIVNILSDYKQHALKGQKLLAQGNALGIMAIGNAPCKGKSFINFRVSVLKLLPLQGDRFANMITQGAALG